MVSDRVSDKVGHAVAIQPTHDIGSVSFDRLDAYFQGDGNFLAALSFSQELHDFALAACEPALWNAFTWCCTDPVAAHIWNQLCNLRSKKRLLTT